MWRYVQLIQVLLGAPGTQLRMRFSSALSDPHFGAHLILKCGGCRSPHIVGCPGSLRPGFVFPPHRAPPGAWMLSPGKGADRATGIPIRDGAGIRPWPGMLATVGTKLAP